MIYLEQTQNTWGTHGDRPTTTTGLPKVAEETPTRMIQQVQFTDDEDDELLGANSKPKEGDPFAEGCLSTFRLVRIHVSQAILVCVASHACHGDAGSV